MSVERSLRSYLVVARGVDVDLGVQGCMEMGARVGVSVGVSFGVGASMGVSMGINIEGSTETVQVQVQL